MNTSNNTLNNTKINTSNNTKMNKINIYNEHYTLFCNNINPSLKKELGIENVNDSNFISDWKPPTTYGLNNSERILPEHYFKSNHKTFNQIDMFYEITKDIRNLKPLEELQLMYIKNLPKEKIVELLEIYNNCFKSINELLK